MTLWLEGPEREGAKQVDLHARDRSPCPARNPECFRRKIGTSPKGSPTSLGGGDPFAAAIRGTRMPMVITDPRRSDNPIVFVNEAFQKLTGYEREEIIGRNCRFLQGPDTDPAAVKRLGQAIAASEPINIDIQNYRKDGSAFWNALYVSPVRAADGEVQFFFASQLNVSERYEAQALIRREKELVDQLVRARTADLQAALEAKTTLLHEVDHRVKNNLTMIGSLLRLQARSIPDKAVRATLDNMLTRVDALATVHRKLYQSDDVSRFDLSAFSESLIADVIGSSGRADIRLETQIGPRLRLRQEGRVGRPDPQRDRYQRHQARLCERPSRDDPFDLRNPKRCGGAGARRRRVRIRSRAAQHRLDRPHADRAALAPDRRDGGVAAWRARHGGGADHPRCGSGVMAPVPLQVLVVEDEAILAMDIEATVEETGHMVMATACCLHEVEALATDQAPDVILLDMQLSDTSTGLDVCAYAVEHWPDATIVFLTANPAKIPADFSGARGVISKPFSRNGLVSAINFISEAVIEPPPVSPKPPSLSLAPNAHDLDWRAKPQPEKD